MKAVVDFESAADALYDAEDAQRGYLELTDRRGNVHQVNLVTISIGVAMSTSPRKYLHPSEVSEVASEMKAVAKKHPGSWVAVDRRSEHLGLARSAGRTSRTLRPPKSPGS